MARTAVVAGTATAVHGKMTKKSDAKQTASDEQAAANQAAFESQQQLAEMQAQKAPAPAAAGGGDDMLAELKQLGDLHAAGILSDEEFTAAKAKVLA